MALITCPDCGHHPVSDRAPNCPKCGAPIPQSAETAPQGSGGSSIRAECEAVLISLCDPNHLGTSCYMTSDSPDYPNTSVTFTDPSVLEQIVHRAGDWIEELDGRGPDCTVSRSGPRLFRSIPNLKSLDLMMVNLDDEALLELSKITSLRRLEMTLNYGDATSRGFLLLAKLGNLEFLSLPSYMGDRRGVGSIEMLEIRKRLRTLMPNTVIK
jgi:hypothetical protein